MATATGLEPATSAWTVQHSNQLSYAAVLLRIKYNMKLYQSILLQNFSRYQDSSYNNISGTDHSCRSPTDTYLLWKYFEYHKPKSALEIGFYAGQSMSIMAESGRTDIELVSIDKNYQSKYKQDFLSLYPDANITFHEIDSMFIEQAIGSKSFDFMLLDGSGEYDIAVNDIKKSLNMINKNGAIYVDEVMVSDCPGVQKAVIQNLYGQRDWIPFLAGQSGMFFHHVSHDASYFLDFFIKDMADRIFRFEHRKDWNGFDVLFVSHPMMFEDHPNLFRDVLRLYDL